MPKEYDVIVIGAGIGGLVCGCYLVKAGRRVVIFEKNVHPGGCCTSFTREGFRFDSAAHTLGGMSPNGPIGKILKDLGITDVPVKRTNPSYVLQIGDYKLNIWNDFSETICDLTKDFRTESRKLKEFWNFISTATSLSLIKIKSLPFSELLGSYFSNKKLQAVLCAPLLGNVGVDPLRVSSFTAIKFYQQYVLDGGYHLDGGMQTLADMLMKRFCELGGEIKLSMEVDKIIVMDRIARGVRINDVSHYAKTVVSNIDCRKTFFDLIGRDDLGSKFIALLNSLKPSSSMYILYLGLLNEKFDYIITPQVTHWFVNNFIIKKIYQNISSGKLTFDWIAMRLSEDRRTLQVFTIAPLMDRKYWARSNLRWEKRLLENISKLIPNITSVIAVSLTANPATISQWTANYNGAACGWESTPSQFSIPGLSQRTNIKNLYLTGHWTTLTLGIPGVSNVGRSTANVILQEI